MLSTTFGAGGVVGQNDIPTAGRGAKPPGAGANFSMTPAQIAQQQAFDQQFFAPLYAKGWTNTQITDWMRSLPPAQLDKINESYALSLSAKLNPDSPLEKTLMNVAEAASLAGIAAIGGEVIAPYVAGAAGGGVAGGILGGAAGGAFTGATDAALTGQPIGKGALTGGVTGGITGGVASTGLNTTPAGKIATGALTGGAGAALRGGDIGQGALTGAAGGAVRGLVGPTLNDTLGPGIGGLVTNYGVNLAKSAVGTGGASPSPKPTASTGSSPVAAVPPFSGAGPLDPYGGTSLTNLPVTPPAPPPVAYAPTPAPVTLPAAPAMTGPGSPASTPEGGPVGGAQPVTPVGVGSGGPIAPVNKSTPSAAPTGTDPGAPAVPPATAPPAAAPPTGTSSGLPDWLNSLLPGGANSATAGLGLETALALYEANKQKQQNDAYASTLTKLGQPFVDASGKALTAAQTGTLNPQQAGSQGASFSQGATLTGQAGPLLDIGNKAFADFTAGALPQWQQAELDQQKAAAIAQLKQSLGAQVDSTTLAQGIQQINTQYDIQKGTLMQQNLAIGENAFSMGVTTQNMGFADIQQGWQTGIDAIQQNYTNAINLATEGFGPIQNAIQLQIQGDTQLTSSLMEMMGLIGMGYAQQVAGAKQPTTPTTPSAPGGVPAGPGGVGIPTAPGGVGNVPSATDPNTGLPVDPSTGQPLQPNLGFGAPPPDQTPGGLPIQAPPPSFGTPIPKTTPGGIPISPAGPGLTVPNFNPFGGGGYDTSPSPGSQPTDPSLDPSINTPPDIPPSTIPPDLFTSPAYTAPSYDNLPSYTTPSYETPGY